MAKREETAVFEALKKFSDGVTSKMTSLTAGEPEDQLRSPFETFMQDVGNAISRPVVCTGEVRLADRLGKPDYAIQAAQLLAGY